MNSAVLLGAFERGVVPFRLIGKCECEIRHRLVALFAHVDMAADRSLVASLA
jgi:hypothetical protein